MTTEKNYATIRQRFAARVVDLVILMICMMAISFIFLTPTNYSKDVNTFSKCQEKEQKTNPKCVVDRAQFESVQIYSTLATLLVVTLYFIGLQYRYKTTPGKTFLKIKVQSTDKELSLKQIALRELPILIYFLIQAINVFVWKMNGRQSIDTIPNSSFMLFGYAILAAIMMKRSKNKQAPHDRLANTEVVKKDQGVSSSGNK